MTDFPTPENPLVVPPWLLDQVVGSHDPRFDSTKARIRDGSIVPIRWLEEPRSGVTPGGIPWKVTA